MTNKDVRRHAVSEWLLEFSVLWAVFPLLDQLVERQPIDPWLIGISLAISLTAAVIGVTLRVGGTT